MYGPEGNSWFCFPRLRLRKHQDSRENKTDQFPGGPTIKYFVIYLDFLLNNHMAKTCNCIWRAGDNYASVSLSGYTWIVPGASDQESTNHSACFVLWKSRYTTISHVGSIALLWTTVIERLEKSMLNME